MKSRLLCGLGASVCLLGIASAVLAQEPVRSDYVSDASFVLVTHTPASREHTPEAMAAAANKFLFSLDDEQRQRAAHALDSPERQRWTNVPPPADAGGVRLGDCTVEQVKAFCDLLATLLSEQGYTKMCNIMLADDQLIRGNAAQRRFGTENFSVVLFGTPSATGPWGFQLDGHHVAMNVAVEGERVNISPSFVGTQPEVFEIAMKRFRPLASETDDAYRLLGSLNEEQRAQAIVGARRGDIERGPGHDGEGPPQAKGVSCAGFNEDQKQILLSLISEWVNDLPPEHARRRMEQLAGQVDQMHFAWSGPTAPGSDISYYILGPTLIIEYSCQDLGGNPLNHLHTMYRDPTDEYGGQLAGQ